MPSSKTAQWHRLESVGTFLFAAPLGMVIASSCGIWASNNKPPMHIVPAAGASAVIHTIFGVVYLGLLFVPTNNKIAVPPTTFVNVIAVAFDVTMGSWFAAQCYNLTQNHFNEKMAAANKLWELLQNHLSGEEIWASIRQKPTMMYALEETLEKYGSPFGLNPECTPFDALLDPTKFPWYATLLMLTITLWIHFIMCATDMALKLLASTKTKKKPANSNNSIGRERGSQPPKPVTIGSRSGTASSGSKSKPAKSARQG